MYTNLELVIGGEKITASRRDSSAVLNPATGEPLARLPHATRDDLDRALEISAQAFKDWKRTLAVDRAKIMRRAADILRQRHEQIARILTLEEGKPLRESRAELTLAIETLDWMADEGRRAYGRVIPGHTPEARVITVQEPVGPVAAFTPWNFPALTTLRKISAALGAGCSIILKAAEETPGTAVEIARAFAEAGLPDGVLQLVFGVPSEISEHLINSDVIRKISFTGSTRVGRLLGAMAASRNVRFTLELGGHAPVLVFADADIEKCVELMGGFKYRNAGQVCVAPTRFFVHESVHDRFSAAMIKYAGALTVGDGMDEANTMGPMANARRIDAMQEFVNDARRSGALVKTGGERIGNRGFHFSPTVLTEVPETARVMVEEPFGPLAPIVRFRDTEEVIAKANSLPFGLSSFAFTQSERTARVVSQEIEAGMVAINSATVSLPQAPFGGIKASGEGSEGGIEGLAAYTHTKLIVQQ
jgi:succinate-semialdehyde dehydrogenase / glutarate-semialdehyde dehydrogenase